MTTSAPGPSERVAAWDAPVLQSIEPVIASSRFVTTDIDAIEAVARWMAWEEFPPLTPEAPDPATIDSAIDYVLVTTAINFAYTDFTTRVPYAIELDGQVLVDAEALFARFDQAIAAGVPLLDGAYLATVTAQDLGRILHGPTEIPMLAERAEVLNAIGRTLVDGYDGHFHVFVRSCPSACFADGNGLLERLVAEFPRFDDSSVLYGQPIKLYKLVQLGVWTLHRLGLVSLTDLDRLTAFPDYIVPAALRVLGIFHYAPDLAATIDEGREVPQGSDAENELRAHTVHATALLTDAINHIRPRELALVVPQLDYRLWKSFHALIQPHHLTRTIMY